MRVETYGLGGYDPSKPNNNIVSVEEIPDPPADPNAVDVAALRAKLAKATSTAGLRAVLADVLDALDQP